MKIFLSGQRSFGKAVLLALIDAGHEITGVAVAPQTREHTKKDKLVGVAMKHGIPIVADGERLVSEMIPDGTELIVSAHSHWIISDKCLEKCRYGGVGFHPSLLPRHRGQDAVRWAVHMGDAITGGTVYRLSNKCDGGDILAREMLFIKPGWDYHDLWNALFPLGVEMLVNAVTAIGCGTAVYEEQDEEVATWEPSWERQRLKRNELIMLGGDAGDAELREECVGCVYDCRWCPKGLNG